MAIFPSYPLCIIQVTDKGRSASHHMTQDKGEVGGGGVEEVCRDTFSTEQTQIRTNTTQTTWSTYVRSAAMNTGGGGEAAITAL